MITAQVNEAVGLIKVDGRFTFQESAQFKSAATDVLAASAITEVGVDLSRATHMDSNALGMLIGLKNRADSRLISVKLVKPSPNVQATLELVQFEKLFLIEA